MDVALDKEQLVRPLDLLMKVMRPLTKSMSDSNEESAQTSLHCLISKDETRLLLMTGLAVFFVAQAIINAGLDHDSTPHNHKLRIATYLGATVVTVIIGVAVTGLSSTLFTALLMVIPLILVGRSIMEDKQVAALEH